MRYVSDLSFHPAFSVDFIHLSSRCWTDNRSLRWIESMVLLHRYNPSSCKVPGLCSPHLMCIMNTSRRPRESNLRVSHSKSWKTSDQQKPDDSVDQLLVVKGKKSKIKGPPDSVLKALLIDRLTKLGMLLIALLVIAKYGLSAAVVTAVIGLVTGRFTT